VEHFHVGQGQAKALLMGRSLLFLPKINIMYHFLHVQISG